VTGTDLAEFWSLIAILIALGGVLSAPILGMRFSDRGVPFWKVLVVGLCGGPLILIGFYVTRLGGYHGACSGGFGDAWPCPFAEFSDLEANNLIFVAPIAIAFLLFFWLAYILDRIARFLRNASGKTVFVGQSPQPVAMQSNGQT
jgi:hypothetical protein